MTGNNIYLVVVKDRYRDTISDGDLVLIQTYKGDDWGQELYQYSGYSESFIPCRKSVRIGNYELILKEIEYDEVTSDKIRRLED